MTRITRGNPILARSPSWANRVTGFTLVELMISMVLGLLVIAGVGSVFLANKDAYRTNEALSQVQDAARTSFEFLAREARQAGSSPCGTNNIQSVLNDGDSMLDGLPADLRLVDGWDDATSVDRDGFPASGAGAPVGGNIAGGGGGGALRLASAKDAGLTLADTSARRTTIDLAAGTGTAAPGDILLICDVDQGAIFQVTGVSSNQIELDGSGVTPGNSTTSLNAGSGGTNYSPTSYLAIPENYIWYVGVNPAGGRSLYRWGLGSSSTSDPQEMVRGVWGMQVQYHEGNNPSFTNWGGVTDPQAVNGIRLTLVVQSRGTSSSDGGRGAGADRQRLERQFSTTLALRNLGD